MRNCAEIEKNATLSLKFVTTILQRVQSGCPNNSIRTKGTSNRKANREKLNLEQEPFCRKGSEKRPRPVRTFEFSTGFLHQKVASKLVALQVPSSFA